MRFSFSPIWLEILSEFFVNLAAGWFAIVFIEPQIASVKNLIPLTFRLFLGIVSLIVAKHLRERRGKL